MPSIKWAGNKLAYIYNRPVTMFSLFNYKVQIKFKQSCFRNQLVLTGLLICSIPIISHSQEDSIDVFIKTNLAKLHIPGASLVITENGKILKSSGYGFSNLELNVQATPKTVYEIGSMTKQFTSLAIMMLMEEGKLRLSDKITRFFPAAPAAWDKITVTHLLTHTSGIQNHVAVPGYLSVFKTNLFHEGFPDKNGILKLFYKLPQEFLPGETWAYDNTGYYLLGLIIEQVSKQAYWSFLEERIFRPLGMNNTVSTARKSIVANRASGYIWMDNAYQNQPALWPFVGFSAGSLMSTVEDLALWDAALYTDKLVKFSTLQLMWKPAKGKDGGLLPYNCGFGWFIDNFHGHRIIQHSGGTPGFSSVIYRFPDDTLSVMLLTNHADKMIDQLAIDIAGMLKPSLARPKVVNDAQPDHTRRLKNIFNGLLKGNFDPKDFTVAMNKFLKTSTGKSLFQWFASMGELGRFQLSNYEMKDVATFRYRVELGNNFYFFTVSMEKTAKSPSYIFHESNCFFACLVKWLDWNLCTGSTIVRYFPILLRFNFCMRACAFLQ